MSMMNISRHASRSLPGVTVLRIQGSIDSDTAPAFERELEGLLAHNLFRLLVDLTEVEYISSAGIGIFVGMLQRFREKPGGDIKACGVSRKVMKVFEAIGLHELMDFCPQESSLSEWGGGTAVASPIHHFVLAAPGAEIYSGEAFTLRVESRDASDRPAAEYVGRPVLSASSGMVFPSVLADFHGGVWTGQITLTGAGEIQLTAADGQWQGSLALTVRERADKTQFPLATTCSTCRASITVPGPDIYRCERCDETFTVDAWGHVFTLKSGSTAQRRKSRYKGMELKINADVNYLGIVRQTIKGLCLKEGMDENTTNSVELAIEEILLNLIEHGNDFDPWQILRIKVEFQKQQLKIVIRDYGDPYDITRHKELSLKSSVAKGAKRGVGTFLVNQLMDQVKYVSTPNYNELTMTKRYGTGEPE